MARKKKNLQNFNISMPPILVEDADKIATKTETSRGEVISRIYAKARNIKLTNEAVEDYVTQTVEDEEVTA